MNKPLTALVLGGSGTIGHQLVKRLKALNYWVRSADRKINEFSASLADQFMIGDLTQPGFVEKAMFAPRQKMIGGDDNAFDMVFMLAAEMGGALYVFTGDNDAEIIYNSAMMNLLVAKTAARFGVKRIFFSSSACCYPENLQTHIHSGNISENMAWQGKPDSIYGIEKLFSEQVYHAFHKNHGLSIRVGRFHNVFAPESVFEGGREKAPAAICRKVALANDGDDIQVYGDGTQRRSFLWIEEAIEGVLRVMDHPFPGPVNIGSSESISITDLVKMVIEISGKKLGIQYVPSTAIGVQNRNSDNTTIQHVLGWAPKQPLRVGMEKLYRWIAEQVIKKKIAVQL